GSPYACSPPNQTFLKNPSDVAVVKVAVTANIPIPNATPVVSNLSATPTVEGGSSILSGTFTDTDAGQTHTVTINWSDGSASSVILAASRRSEEPTSELESSEDVVSSLLIVTN